MKKVWYKRWYVWVIGILVVGMIGNIGKDEPKPAQETSAVVKQDMPKAEPPKQGTKVDAPKAEEQKQEAKINAVFDINQIARKSEDEVNKILGEPSKTEDGKWRWYGTENRVDYKKNYYKGDKIEILFIEGKANRISINISEQEFQKDDNLKNNFAYIGLPNVQLEKPIIEGQKSHIVKVDGFYNVQLNKGNKDGAILVTTDEKYR